MRRGIGYSRLQSRKPASAKIVRRCSGARSSRYQETGELRHAQHVFRLKTIRREDYGLRGNGYDEHFPQL